MLLLAVARADGKNVVDRQTLPRNRVRRRGQDCARRLPRPMSPRVPSAGCPQVVAALELPCRVALCALFSAGYCYTPGVDLPPNSGLDTAVPVPVDEWSSVTNDTLVGVRPGRNLIFSLRKG